MPQGLLDDNQKKDCRRMLEAIAARIKSDKPPVILDDERATLRRCWKDGARIVAELNIIRAVHGRMRGIKTPAQIAAETKQFVDQGRRDNGLT